MITEFEISIPLGWIERAAQYYSNVFESVSASGTEYEKVIHDCLSTKHTLEFLDFFYLLSRTQPLKPGSKVLIIGSGLGADIITLTKVLDLEVFGVEPGGFEFNESLLLSRELLEFNNISPFRVVQAVGEAIPFPDNHFDLVYSTSVLEHVIDPKVVLTESIRICNPGAFSFHHFPNYFSFWEGHYGIFKLPWMGKFTFGLMCKILRRSTEFLDTLNWLDTKSTSELIHSLGQVEVVGGTGEEVFLKRIERLNELEGYGLTYKILRLLRFGDKLNLTGALKYLVPLKMFYPLYITLKKRHFN
jgi:ubiquinone/menaquinone biosynthesis C-methylase UbiE